MLKQSITQYIFLKSLKQQFKTQQLANERKCLDMFDTTLKHHSNVCESEISRYTLLITDVESGVKRRVSKILLECSM